MRGKLSHVFRYSTIAWLILHWYWALVLYLCQILCDLSVIIKAATSHIIFDSCSRQFMNWIYTQHGSGTA